MKNLGNLKFAAGAVFLFLAALPLPGQVAVGEPAPRLGFEHLLDRSLTGEELPDIAGKVVVLEFWATWCAPCVKAIPHMNQLAEEFRSQPVLFLHVTDEDQETVARFLKHRPIRSLIALDTDRSVFQSYGIEVLPTTVLLNPEGRVAGYTMPADVTAAVLTALLEGRQPLLRATRPAPAADPVGAEVQAVPDLHVLVRPAPPSQSFRREPGMFRARGMTLRDALAQAFGVSRARLLVPELLAATTYEIEIHAPQGKEEAVDRLLRQALAEAFSLQWRREVQEMEVYILDAVARENSGLRAPAGSVSWLRSNEGQIAARNFRLQALARALEDQLHRPVLDATGLLDSYDFELYWEPGKPQALAEALREQLGLRLVPARRELEILVVEIDVKPE